MKIWYITSEFPPSYGGGIGMYVDIISRLMSDAGHQVAVFAWDAQDKEEHVNENLTYIRFEASRNKSKAYERMGYWTALSYQYYEVVRDYARRNGEPDIIESQDYNGLAYYILQYKLLEADFLRSTRIIVHLHTPMYELARINREAEYAFPTYWLGRMEKFCIEGADALVTQSDFLKKNIQREFPDKEITVIRLPYEYKGLEVQYECGDYLLYTGRMEYRKGILQFIEQMVPLWEQGNKTKLVVLGGDTYFAPKDKNLGDVIQEKNRRWIEAGMLEFKETVPPEEFNRIVAKARGIVIPSIYENFPYTCVISMWQGCPMLVSKQGGQGEMVGDDGKRGLVFDWEIEGDCTRKIEKFLALTEPQLREMGRQGQSHIRELCAADRNVRAREAFLARVKEQPPRKSFPVLNARKVTEMSADAEKGERGLLSVIICYYNLGDTIMETMESLAQIDYER